MSCDSLSMGKVRLAVERLAADYPFHAGILAQWRLEEGTETETMGVGFQDGKLRLVFAPEFVETLPMAQLEGVLHHEVNHVLFGHVLHVRAPNENAAARTIAEEVTVNEWVSEPLPTGVIRLGDFPYLPENEDTETRYGRLRKKIKPPKNTASKPGRKPGSDPSTKPGSGKEQDGASTQPGQGKGKGKAKGKSAPASMPDQETGGIPTLDDHSIWEEIRDNPEDAAFAIDMDSAQAWGSLDEKQKAAVDDSARAAIEGSLQRQGMDRTPGTGTDAVQEEIGGGTAQVPWQQVLQRKVQKTIPRARPVFNRPPRRFPDMIGILPGKARRADEMRVLAAIDTSASMTAPTLAVISAELGRMSRVYTVTVVECDTEIHDVYPYRPIKSVRGRGGTDLRPPLDPAFLKKQKAGLVVYFTDGEGPAPEKEPSIPVIWAITKGGEKPTRWGDEIRLKGP